MKNNSVGIADGLINQKLNAEQEINLINESGLYSLILTSRKPEAKKFKKWVTAEVLPAIRKTGRYEAHPPKLPPDTLPFKLVPMIVRAARALGLDKNAAAISANQVVTKMTGTNAHSQAHLAAKPADHPHCGNRSGNDEGRVRSPSGQGQNCCP